LPRTVFEMWWVRIMLRRLGWREPGDPEFSVPASRMTRARRLIRPFSWARPDSVDPGLDGSRSVLPGCRLGCAPGAWSSAAPRPRLRAPRPRRFRRSQSGLGAHVADLVQRALDGSGRDRPVAATPSASTPSTFRAP